MALEIFYSALHWSKKAERSATSAANSARTAQTAAAQSSQASGKIIQLGFDGAIEDGKLVFKHAPSGVEVPYELLDDYEYEVDLSYDSLEYLSSDLPMVIKNGPDTVTFVSALHRDSTSYVTVGDMKAVMRFNADTGYRWLFKAAFKIAPNGDKVFLLYPVVSLGGSELNNPFFLGLSQYFESEPNNASWLISNGTFHSGATYVSFYEWLLRIYNGTETVDGVSVKTSTDTYDDYDYVINTADTTFRLPLLDGSESLSGGRIIESIFTNLTTTQQNYTCPANGFIYVGANFSQPGSMFVYKNGEEVTREGASSTANNSSAYFSVRKGDIISAKSDTASTHTTVSYFEYAEGNDSLYFYVGETIQDANVIAASQVLTSISQVLSSMSNKANIDFSNVASNIDYVVESYSNGTNWYKIYKSGWIEQGGRMGSSTTSVAFLKPFADTNYNLQISLQSGNSSAISFANAGFSGKTATGFSRTDTIGAQYYTAMEYLANGKGA